MANFRPQQSKKINNPLYQQYPQLKNMVIIIMNHSQNPFPLTIQANVKNKELSQRYQYVQEWNPRSQSLIIPVPYNKELIVYHQSAQGRSFAKINIEKFLQNYKACHQLQIQTYLDEKAEKIGQTLKLTIQFAQIQIKKSKSTMALQIQDVFIQKIDISNLKNQIYTMIQFKFLFNNQYQSINNFFVINPKKKQSLSLQIPAQSIRDQIGIKLFEIKNPNSSKQTQKKIVGQVSVKALQLMGNANEQKQIPLFLDSKYKGKIICKIIKEIGLNRFEQLSNKLTKNQK